MILIKPRLTGARRESRLGERSVDRDERVLPFADAKEAEPWPEAAVRDLVDLPQEWREREPELRLSERDLRRRRRGRRGAGRPALTQGGEQRFGGAHRGLTVPQERLGVTRRSPRAPL